jgi:hypothetical protein
MMAEAIEPIFKDLDARQPAAVNPPPYEKSVRPNGTDAHE